MLVAPATSASCLAALHALDPRPLSQTAISLRDRGELAGSVRPNVDNLASDFQVVAASMSVAMRFLTPDALAFADELQRRLGGWI